MFAVYFTGTVIAMIIVLVVAFIYLAQCIENSMINFSEKFNKVIDANIVHLLETQNKQNYILIDIGNSLAKGHSSQIPEK